jgi:hypothetical protein
MPSVLRFLAKNASITIFEGRRGAYVKLFVAPTQAHDTK